MTACPQGSLNIGSQGGANCIAYSVVNGEDTVTLTNIGVTLFKMNVIVFCMTSLTHMKLPLQVGTVQVRVVTGTSNLYIDGRNYAAPNPNGRNCLTPAPNQQSGPFTYVMSCYTPREGDFYILLSNSGNAAATVTFSQTTCPITTAGYNCSSTLAPISITSDLQVNCNFTIADLRLFRLVTIPGSPNNLDVIVSGVFYYFDIPASFSAQNANLTFVPSSESANSVYIIARRNGFPNLQFGYDCKRNRTIRTNIQLTTS